MVFAGQMTQPTVSKHGSCWKTTLQVYQWRADACRRMVSWDTRTQFHKIRGISFERPDPHVDNYHIRLTAFFQENLGKPAPERHLSGAGNVDK